MANQRERARQSVTRFARRLQRAIVTGQLGNNAGTVDHPTRTNWVWVRLHGDSNQVIAAHCPATAGVVHQADIVVALERVSRAAAPYYEVLGLANGILYPGNDFEELIGPHAAQHERRNFAQGGPDAVDVYARMHAELRARAQSTPDWTLYVEAGFYVNAGQIKKWTGGNSPAFTPPAGTPVVIARRCDLLYLAADDTLKIAQGTATLDGSTPAYPATPADCCYALVYVFLDSTLGAITEDYLEDPRDAGGASAVPAAHHTTHESGGDDEIKLDDLGEPDNNTDLDATDARHGLLPKLSGDASDFLSGDGSWASAAGGGDVVGPASATDGHMAVFDGTGGKTLKDGGVPTGAYVQLAQTIVGAGGAATISFSSISGSYSQLVLILWGRGEASATEEACRMQLNGDNTAKYYDQMNVSHKNTVDTYESIGGTYQNVGSLPAATAPASAAGQIEIVFAMYSNTSFLKTFTSKCSHVLAASSDNLRNIFATGYWNNTAAISIITLFLASGNFAQNTVATLYGIS